MFASMSPYELVIDGKTFKELCSDGSAVERDQGMAPPAVSNPGAVVEVTSPQPDAGAGMTPAKHPEPQST